VLIRLTRAVGFDFLVAGQPVALRFHPGCAECKRERSSPGRLPLAAVRGQPRVRLQSSILRFGFRNPMPESVRTILEGSLTVLRYGPDGLPLVQNGHYVPHRLRSSRRT